MIHDLDLLCRSGVLSMNFCVRTELSTELFSYTTHFLFFSYRTPLDQLIIQFALQIARKQHI